jgi:hypothetical protein
MVNGEVNAGPLRTFSRLLESVTGLLGTERWGETVVEGEGDGAVRGMGIVSIRESRAAPERDEDEDRGLEEGL